MPNGNSGHSITKRGKGDMDTMSDINFPLQHQLVQSLVMELSLKGQY